MLQLNDRVAEVQYICDSCGKLTRTSIISRDEFQAQKDDNVICWHCRQKI